MISIYFRVDSNNKIGMGHLIESISLAKSLKKRADCNIIFITNNFPPTINILEKEGYIIEIIDKYTDKEAEIDKIIKLIKKYGIGILICDLFNKSKEYFQKLESASILVNILDNNKHDIIPGEIVVNFSITQNNNFYKDIRSKTSYLVGPKYTPLSENICEEWEKEKEIPKECRNIFVNQGGSDPFGLTIKIIKALEFLDLKQSSITVVIGHAISKDHEKELINLKSQLKNNYQFRKAITQKEMHQLIAKSDLAITAAGNTLYELAIFGIPSIVICHHEMHNAVAEKFAEENAVINLGIGSDLDISLISKTINDILLSVEKRKELSINMKKITDGLGSKRIADKILETWEREY